MLLPSTNVGCSSPRKPPKPVHSFPSHHLAQHKSHPFTDHVQHSRRCHTWILHCKPSKRHNKLLTSSSMDTAFSQNNARAFVRRVLTLTFESTSGELLSVFTWCRILTNFSACDSCIACASGLSGCSGYSSNRAFYRDCPHLRHINNLRSLGS